MKIKAIKTLLVSLLLCTLLSSCGLSRIGEQVEVKGVEEIGLKGFTALGLTIGYVNDSKYDLKLSDGVVDIFVDQRQIMTLRQADPITASRKSEGSIETLWRIEGANPLTMLAYSKRFMAKDFTGVTIDYSVELKANKLGKRFSGKDIDLTKFMTIFASETSKRKQL